MKGVCGGVKIFGSALLSYYSKRTVFASLWAIFCFHFITYNVYISKHAFPVTILQNMYKCAKKNFSFWGLCLPGPLPRLCHWIPLRDFRPRTSWLASVYSRPPWGNPLRKIRNPQEIVQEIGQDGEGYLGGCSIVPLYSGLWIQSEFAPLAIAGQHLNTRAETWCDDWGDRSEFFFTSPPKFDFFLGGDAWFCTDIEQIWIKTWVSI